ncbi:hypothetical protein [Pseudoalteromonas aliena]|uniref:Bacteriocin n=1 Tax=Pseudoalteromonas aliena SW19 TaxID=1314866 RepID=A0ABR9DUU9_9GAMM|nr:hypothetical protein [Pseudoalteromonas aliena]MBE0358110.1 hypothetical protein [Pseudoalteromonas aliena SW19]
MKELNLNDVQSVAGGIGGSVSASVDHSNGNTAVRVEVKFEW